MTGAKGRSMHRVVAAALLAAAPLSAAPAQTSTVAEFLARATPVEKKGLAGMFSAEGRRLRQEVGKAAEATRAEQENARRAGRPPATCLPPKGKAKINGKELLAYFRAIPLTQRGQSLQAAFAGFASKKYPCPA
jgi:hypothetical protein